MKNKDTRQTISLKLKHDIHKRLKTLAQLDRRTIINYLQIKVEQIIETEELLQNEKSN